MHERWRVSWYALVPLFVVVVVVVLVPPANAQTPTPSDPGPAIQGAEVAAGSSSTFAGVTIVNRLNGPVTYSSVAGIINITIRNGTVPFVLSSDSGGNCSLTPAEAATGARCTASRGTTIILIGAAGQAPRVLPRTGVALTTRAESTDGWMFKAGVAVGAVASITGVIRTRRGSLSVIRRNDR